MAALLVLMDLAIMSLLPVTFFRRGHLGLRWWLTALPFVVAGATVATHVVWPLPGIARSPLLDALALLVAAGALMLLLVTRAAHRRPIALWHQPDPPPALVTHGPYAHVRHPFYSSFGLMLLAAVLAAPHALTVLALAWGWAALAWTARCEERVILTSSLGDEYRAHASRTGRFLPRVSAPW